MGQERDTTTMGGWTRNTKQQSTKHMSYFGKKNKVRRQGRVKGKEEEDNAGERIS